MDHLSPSTLAADPVSQTICVSESTANQVAIWDTVTSKVRSTVKLPGPPGGLALSPDGGVLYVSGTSPEGRVHVVNVAEGKWVTAMGVGHSPGAMAIAPQGDKLYVCNRFDHSVSVITLGSRRETARIPVLREPASIALTPDGRHLFVANSLPAGPATGGYVAAAVSVIDAAEQRKIADIRLPNGSTDLHDICLSSDGQYAYVVHTLARYFVPATQLDRGWMNTSALSILDVAQKRLVETVLLDEINRGAANPWGVACTADGKLLCVTHAGTHETSIIDRSALHLKLDDRSTTATVPAIAPPDDLTFLDGIRQRVPVRGKGPRGLVIVGTQAYVAEYFTDSLGVVPLVGDTPRGARSIALGPRTPLTAARRGEIMFHDADRCYQKWQSCASCHPGGRVDALNWDLLNDGIGNPKNNRSLLHVDRRKPVMSLGARDSSNQAVHAGFKAIQFAQISDRENADVLAYLKSLRPVSSPCLVNGQLSEAAHRGKRIFAGAGCGNCHSGRDHTDLKAYDLGYGTGPDTKKAFITAPLTEVWRTAPYLYDGRAATMLDVLTVFNRDDKHGATSGLTPEQLDDLVVYLLSL